MTTREMPTINGRGRVLVFANSLFGISTSTASSTEMMIWNKSFGSYGIRFGNTDIEAIVCCRFVYIGSLLRVEWLLMRVFRCFWRERK